MRLSANIINQTTKQIFSKIYVFRSFDIDFSLPCVFIPINAKLNPICPYLALFEDPLILHVSR